jgi:hypothetical protein
MTSSWGVDNLPGIFVSPRESLSKAAGNRSRSLAGFLWAMMVKVDQAQHERQKSWRCVVWMTSCGAQNASSSQEDLVS